MAALFEVSAFAVLDVAGRKNSDRGFVVQPVMNDMASTENLGTVVSVREPKRPVKKQIVPL